MTLPTINARKFTIIAVIVVFVVLGILIIVAALAPKQSGPTPTGPLQPITTPITSGNAPSVPLTTLPSSILPTAPSVPAASTTVARTDGTTNAALTTDGNGLVGYNRTSGMFSRIDGTGRLTPLSDETFPFAQQVTWSPDRTKAVLEFPDNAKILYDFTLRRATTLPRHWQEFSFAPTSDAMVFKSLGLDPGNQWLVTAKPDGSNAVPVEELGDKAHLVVPTWSPNGQVVGLYAKPLDQTRSTLLFLGPNRESYPSAVIEGINVTATWSPNGDRLLYSAATAQDQWKPTLWIIDSSTDRMGQNRLPIGIQTWADKCTFRSGSTQKLLCAVPQTLPDGAGLVRNSVEKTDDSLVEVDLASGIQRTLPVGTFDSVAHLLTAADGHTLFVQEGGAKEIKKIQL